MFKICILLKKKKKKNTNMEKPEADSRPYQISKPDLFTKIDTDLGP